MNSNISETQRIPILSAASTNAQNEAEADADEDDYFSNDLLFKSVTYESVDSIVHYLTNPD